MGRTEIERLKNGMPESPQGSDKATKGGEYDNSHRDDVQQERAGSKKELPKTEADEVRFEELADRRPNKGPNDKGVLDMEFILDIPLNLTVELGRNRLLIKDLLQLGQGSIIELTKLAGEPMDIYVNQRLIARGEVVVVNQKFGVRLTDIVSPAERVKGLK